MLENGSQRGKSVDKLAEKGDEFRQGTFLNIYSPEPGLVDESLIYTSVTQLMDQLLTEFGPLPATYKDPRATPNTIRIRTNIPNK